MRKQDLSFIWWEQQVSLVESKGGKLVKYSNNETEEFLISEYGETTAHKGTINKVKISSCGTYGISVGDDKVAKLWNLVNNDFITLFESH